MKLIQLTVWVWIFATFEPLLSAQLIHYPTQLKLTRDIGLNSSVQVFDTRVANEQDSYVYPGSYVHNMNQLVLLGGLGVMDWFSYQGVPKITEPPADNLKLIVNAQSPLIWPMDAPFVPPFAEAISKNGNDISHLVKIDHNVNAGQTGLYSVIYQVRSEEGDYTEFRLVVEVVSSNKEPAIESILFKNGILTIHYTGILQISNSVYGPWVDVADHKTPYLSNANKQSEFYRVVFPDVTN
jgi:hypothetical protein